MDVFLALPSSRGIVRSVDYGGFLAIHNTRAPAWQSGHFRE